MSAPSRRMAWVEKHPQGFLVRWRLDDGSRPYSGPYGSRAEAQAAADEFNAKQPKRRRGKRPGATPVEPHTLAALTTAWREAMMEDAERMARPGAQHYLDDVLARVHAQADAWKLPDRACRPGDVTVDMAKALKQRAQRTSANVRAIMRWAHGKYGTPLDPVVDAMLKPKPSKHARVERITERHARAVLARARRNDQLALVSCLMLYGWRPITACRRNVGHVDLKGATIEIDRKHGDAMRHPLFPFHVEMLRPLVEGRPKSAPLFVPPRPQRTKKGERSQREKDRWTVSKTGSAGMLAVWCARRLGVPTYQIKRLALSRMLGGEWPWTRPLTPAEVALYTGQQSAAIVERYERTNLERARSLMAPDAHGQSMGNWARKVAK